MDQHGPTWSQKDTKREPKAAKMKPKAPTLRFYVEKIRQKAIKKNDVQKRSVPGRSPAFGLMLLWSSFGGKGGPKGAFLEIPKIENGTKTAQWMQDQDHDPLKTISDSGFEKT